ncbi:hypothetical protein D9757_001800 [Collybiopsis confluens]|uniref:Translation initiation factor IF-2, mitochondrial n=1 Tax=Collybiopsis confluens TaxID=2823264 RepID=A0A8H5HYE2_9AGAR|nr:hypothetical protein D9757_001800 [Collybiopsis confluens]
MLQPSSDVPNTPAPNKWARPPNFQWDVPSPNSILSRASTQSQQTPLPTRSWTKTSQHRQNESRPTPTTQSPPRPQNREKAPHLNPSFDLRQPLRSSGSSSWQQKTQNPSSASSWSERRQTTKPASESRDLWSSYVDNLDQEKPQDDRRSNRSQSGPKHRSRGSLIEKLRSASEQSLGDSRKNYLADRNRKQKTRKNKSFVGKKVAEDVYIPSMVSVGQLAQLLDIRLARLQRKMEQSGLGEETSYNHVLTSDYAVLLAEEFGKNPIVNDEMAFDIYPSPPHPNPSSLPLRPPVVTIMGHVDHGKTTLLDTLRSTSVAKGEAGGITQHIGAFSVPSDGGKGDINSITFLDTPGHAAFSAMRARGASVTDIIVLVVAADDGVMPQTREVINLIKKEQDKVGVVVAINKVDKPGVNTEAVQESLLAEGLQLEQMGGEVPAVEVSGKTGHGLPSLVETLSAIAEMQDLRAEHTGPVHGYILESNMHKGLGPVATVLVLRGCLTVSSHIISGLSHARVRIMSDSNGKLVKTATPGMAVTVSGWKTLPSAGDQVLQGPEADIKKAMTNRERKAELEASLLDAEAINSVRKQERENRELEVQLGKDAAANMQSPVEEGLKELRLVIKSDVSGSAEAAVGALQDIGNDVATSRIVASSVGDVTESDVTLAQAASGMIVAFNVKVPKQIQSAAAQKGVTILSSNIIYKLMDEVKDHVIKLLPVVIEKKVTGEADVLQVFDIQGKKQIVKVAGCRVTSGMVERSKQAQVIRNGQTIHEGPIDTLRVVKKDVSEVRKGSECGLSLANFSDLQAGDFIQMFTTLESPGIL